MADDINARIGIDFDTSEALASLKNLQRQISQFNRQLANGSAANASSAANLNRNLINDINASGKFVARLQTIRSTTENFTNALEKNKLSMGEYFRYGAAASGKFTNAFQKEFGVLEKVSRERVKTLQTQYISLGRDANGALRSISVRPLMLDLDDLGTKQMMAAQRQQIFNQLLKQGSTNLLNFGKNTQWAGRQLMVGFTIPLSIFGNIASKTFMELEEEAIRFRRVYGELFTPPEETDAMLQSLQELGREFTKYGISVSDTLGLAADAAAMGKTGVDLLGQVTEASRLSVLGSVDQQQALETTISLTNAFGIANKDLASNIDFLNAVENQTVTSIEDLTIAIPKAGPVIKQLGGDAKDLAFFLTAMKEGGINASEGANALKSGLARIINPTKEASEFLSNFNINVREIVSQNRGDVKGIVLELATALDALDPLNRAQAIERLFGKFQFARISALFQNVIQEGNQASRVLELTNATTQELAQLSAKELNAVTQTTTYKFKAAVEDFQAAVAPVGEEFLKLITPVVEFGTKILDAFNNMSDGAKRTVVTIVAVLGGIAPIALMTFGLVANGVANLIKGFLGLSNIFKRFKGDTTTLGMGLDYMTQEQLQASAAAASLEQSHLRLSQMFTVEKDAVNALATAYIRAAEAGRKLTAVKAMPTNIGGRKAPKFAMGGIVRGPGTGTSDSIIARVSNGEAIIPADSVRQNSDMVKSLIANNVPKFRDGGRVGSGAGGRIGKSKAAVLRPYGANVSNTGGLTTFGNIGGDIDVMSLYADDIAKAAKTSIQSINREVDDWRAANKKMLDEAEQAVENGADPAKAFAKAGKKFQKDMEAANGPVAKFSKTAKETIPQFNKDLKEAQAAAKKLNLDMKKGKDVAKLAQTLPNNIIAQKMNKPGAFSALSKTRSAGMAMMSQEYDKYGVPTGFVRPDLETNKLLYKQRASAEHFSRNLTHEQNLQQNKEKRLKRDATSEKKLDQTSKQRAANAKKEEQVLRAEERQLKQRAARARDPKTGRFVSQSVISAGVAPASQALISNNSQIVENTNRFKKLGGAMTGVSYSLTSVAGLLSMFGGQIGETANKIFMVTAAFTALGEVTRALTTKTLAELAASRASSAALKVKAAAGLGKEASLFVSGAGFRGLLTNIGRLGSAILRFIGPVGFAIGAIAGVAGGIKLLLDAKEEERKKTWLLADAAEAGKEQLEAFANIAGSKAVLSPLEQIANAPAGASIIPTTANRRTAIDTMKQDENFLDSYSDLVSAVRISGAQKASDLLESYAVMFSGQGFGEEYISNFVQAIKELAGKTDLELEFSTFDLSESSTRAKLSFTAQSIGSQFGREFAAAAEKEGFGMTGMQAVLQGIVEDPFKNVSAAYDGAEGLRRFIGDKIDAGDTLALVDLNIPGGYQAALDFYDGIIDRTEEMDVLVKTASGSFGMLARGISSALVGGSINANQFNQSFAAIEKGIRAIPFDDLGTRGMVLNDIFATYLPEGLRESAQETGDLATKLMVLKAAMLGITDINVERLAGDFGAQAQLFEYDKLTQEIRKQMTALEAINKITSDYIETTEEGGEGAKSIYEQAIEQLVKQRAEIKNNIAAYSKLRKAGFDINEAFSVAQDATLAAAVATTKVGTEQWSVLVSLIEQANEEARKLANNNLVKQRAGEIQLKKDLVAILPALKDINLSASDVDAILSNPDLAKELISDLKDGKLDAKDLQNYLKQIASLKKLEIQIQLSTTEGRRQAVDDALSDINEYFAAQKNALQVQFDIDTESLQDKIKSDEALVASYNTEISYLEYQLDGIADKESEINKKYDDRVKALDEVDSINSRIATRQQSLLDIASALAQGDIAAAANAQREAQQRMAEEARQSQRERLDAARELELANIRSKDGRTREQLEALIEEKRNKILEIENESLATNKATLQAKQDQLDKDIKALSYLGLSETAWSKVEAATRLARVESDAYKKSIEDSLALIKQFPEEFGGTDLTDNYTGQGESQVPGGTGNTGGATQPDPNADKIAELNRRIQITRYRVRNDKSLSSQVVNALMDLNVKRINEVKKLNGIPNMSGMIQPGTTSQITGLPAGFAMGGMVPYMRTGGMFKSMGTDRMPAMLTPGEFVMRRPSVRKYGSDMMKALNNGTYNGESVYNYSVNVNVKSDANPEQIARAVMTQIKQVESQRIRSNRY